MILNITDETFKENVINAQGTIVVDFWAPWCGPCKTVAPIFEKLSQEISDVQFAKIDVDTGVETAQMCSIRGVPTFVVFKNGSPIAQKSGAMTEPQLRMFIETHKSND